MFESGQPQIDVAQPGQHGRMAGWLPPRGGGPKQRRHRHFEAEPNCAYPRTV